MFRLRLFLLATVCLPTAIAAHADTINHVVLTYIGVPTYTGVAPIVQQYNFSFLDGVTVTDIGSQSYSFSVMAYQGTDPVGTPLAGYFGLNLLLSGTTINVGSSVFAGTGPLPLKSIGHPSFLAATLFFNPGTYVLSDGTATSTSYTLTQTTTGAAAPISVTPEPSSLVLLGTGLLGFAGVVRRRYAQPA